MPAKQTKKIATIKPVELAIKDLLDYTKHFQDFFNFR